MSNYMGDHPVAEPGPGNRGANHRRRASLPAAIFAVPLAIAGTVAVSAWAGSGGTPATAAHTTLMPKTTQRGALAGQWEWQTTPPTTPGGRWRSHDGQTGAGYGHRWHAGPWADHWGRHQGGQPGEYHGQGGTWPGGPQPGSYQNSYRRPDVVVSVASPGAFRYQQGGVYLVRLANLGDAPARRVAVGIRLAPGIMPSGFRGYHWACSAAPRWEFCRYQAALWPRRSTVLALTERVYAAPGSYLVGLARASDAATGRVLLTIGLARGEVPGCASDPGQHCPVDLPPGGHLCECRGLHLPPQVSGYGPPEGGWPGWGTRPPGTYSPGGYLVSVPGSGDASGDQVFVDGDLAGGHVPACPGTGTTPGSGTGSQPDSATGSQPGTGTGSQPGTGTGSQQCSGDGSQPGTGPGSQPGGVCGCRELVLAELHVVLVVPDNGGAPAGSFPVVRPDHAAAAGVSPDGEVVDVAQVQSAS